MNPLSRYEVILPALVGEELARWVDRSRPAEACGAFAYRVSVDGWRILRPVQIPNRARDPIAGFRIRQDDLLAAVRSLRLGRGERVGVFHSHGIGPARPSLPDRLLVARMRTLHLIASPADGITCWWPAGTGVITVPVRHARR